MAGLNVDIQEKPGHVIVAVLDGNLDSETYEEAVLKWLTREIHRTEAGTSTLIISSAMIPFNL